MVNRNQNKAAGDYYPGYRHPKILIGYVVWSYHRFTLSLRDVSEQLMNPARTKRPPRGEISRRFLFIIDLFEPSKIFNH